MLFLERVTKTYLQPDGTKLPVLNVPQYSLAAGEQAVLMGSSGGGKTTLLHIIAGITRPDPGPAVVRINGQDVARLPEPRRDLFRAQHVGYVFQTFNLLPAFTALENVMLGMVFARGAADAGRARHLLERVGLGHRLTHRPHQLSVGEQQRVNVARALANGPKLLLADEPTANVDVAHQRQVVDLIRQTCQEDGITLLLVTHAPEVARQFDRVDRLEQINRLAAEVSP